MPNMPRDGISFPYVDTESGIAPIVFVNPFGGTMGIWREQRAYFEDLNYRVILYDQRGHGRNQGTASEGKRGEYSIELFAHDLEALMDHCGVQRATLVGASLGAMVALEYAGMHPTRVHGLVLVGGYAPPLLRKGYKAKNRKVTQSFLADHKRIRKEGISVLKESKIKSYFGKPYEDLSEQEQRACDIYFKDVAEMRIKEYIAADLAILHKKDQTPVLRQIGDQFRDGLHFNYTHFITGERDFFRDAQTEMQACAPGSRIVVIPNAGHLCWLNQSTLFNEQLHLFLRDSFSTPYMRPNRS